MNGRTISVLLLCLVANTIAAKAQSNLNVDNTIKAYGSFDGSSVDMINLQNGNLVVQIPLPAGPPQRGEAATSHFLTVSSKTWSVQTVNNQNLWTPSSPCGGPASGPCGQGRVFLSGASFTMERVYTDTIDGFGGTVEWSDPQSLSAWDGTHGLVAIATNGTNATILMTTDGSDYRVEMHLNDPNSAGGSATVIDRNGNRYDGKFGLVGGCKVTQGAAGGVQGSQTQTTTCKYEFSSGAVTDTNGNVYNTTDTLGRPTVGIPSLAGPSVAAGSPSIATTQNADLSGCYNAFGIPWVGFLSYPAPYGGTDQIKLCFAPYAQIVTNFSQPNVLQYQQYATGQPIYLTNVFLPDGTQWQFAYDSYGEVTNITTPGGVSIAYTWQEVSFPSCGDLTQVSRAVKTRTVTDVNGNTFKWTYHWGVQAADRSLTNTVTDPNSNDTLHVFKVISKETPPPPSYCNFFETATKTYQGTAGSQAPLKEVDISYLNLGNTVILPTSIQTIVNPGNLVSLVQKFYDGGNYAGVPSVGDVTQELEFDFGAGAHGPLLRQTDKVYQWQADTTGAYNIANLLNLPASVVTCSPNDPTYNPSSTTALATCNQKTGTFTKLAETDTDYDDPARLNASGVTTQHGAAPTSVRGNPTSSRRWLNTSNTFITSNTTWYDTGMPHQQIDPGGHATSFSYDSAFYGAYPTQTCDPMNHCVNGSYDFNTGLLTSFTDQNKNQTSYGYDSLGRITSATFPNLGSVTARYPNLTTVEFLKPITASLTDDSYVYFDGLGHVAKTVHASASCPVTTQMSYDGLGHLASATNPYCSTTEPTYGTTTNLYDALGRVKQTTKPDGSYATSSYSGSCSTNTDEAGKTRKLCSDALGRVLEVDEPGAPFAGSSAMGSITVNGTLRNTGSNSSATPGSAILEIACAMTNCVDQSAICDTCLKATTIYDKGTISITINGWTTPSTATSYNNTTTPSTIASTLINAINGSGTNGLPGPVTAKAYGTSGVQIQIVSKAAGTASNYAWSSTASSAYTTFKPSFFVSPTSGTMSGGKNATTTVIYDSGTVTLSLNGPAVATVCYGASANAICSGKPQNNTTTAVANALASALASNSQYTVTASDVTLSFTAKSVGTAGNAAIAITSTPDNAPLFPGGSFSGSGALSGGTDADSTGLATPYVTLYRYDGLGNLLQVTQQGGTTDQTQWRVRSFQYDSLSRLTSAFNPEAGQISYTYNADGLVIGRDRPRANQADPTILTHTTYGYDSDHHLTSLSYGDATGTNAVFNYNESAAAGLTISNPLDRLTSQTNGSSTQAFSYDSMGRVLTIRNVIGSISKDIGYKYNLNGSVAKLIYPSLAAVDYTPDSAGQILSAVDSGNGINYVTQATYNAPGEITGYINGGGLSTAGITTSFSYNQRTQPVFLQASTPAQTVLSIGYDFHLSQGDNGDVLQRINNLDPTRNQTFTYDALNRLSSAQNSGTDCTQTTSGGQSKFWGTTYAYDPWGNLLSKNLSKCSAPPLSVAVNAANRIIGYGYDAAGNLLNTGAGSASSTYDAAGRITSAGGYSYGYDAGGNRVSKSAGSMGTLYWFGTPGIVAESDLAGNIQHEYAFMGGKRVARRDSTGDVFYYFSDFLNSTSVITDASGNVVSDSDYLPWGEEQVFKNTFDNHFKFDGKERDAETGLDNFGARYYANAMGRFTSPDWSANAEPVPYARLGNPQSLNLYSFAWNNPESLSDSDGHAVTTSEKDLIDCKKDQSNPKCVQRSKKSTCDGPVECAHRDYSRLPIPILKPWVPPPNPSVRAGLPQCSGLVSWLGNPGFEGCTPHYPDWANAFVNWGMKHHTAIQVLSLTPPENCGSGDSEKPQDSSDDARESKNGVLGNGGKYRPGTGAGRGVNKEYEGTVNHTSEPETGNGLGNGFTLAVGTAQCYVNSSH